MADGLPFQLEVLTSHESPTTLTICIFAFHSTGYGECLLNEPGYRAYSLPSQMPGLLYNVNKQCELIFGQGYQLCPYMVSVWGLILDFFLLVVFH